MDQGLVEAGLRDAARMGYTVASFSGGEPTLYPALVPMLRVARDAGLNVVITTNGARLRPSFLERTADLVDGWAVSLDGVERTHDRMRGRPGAFQAALGGIDAVRATGVPCAVVFTLTQHNVHELELVADVAADHGAAVLHVHPLELEGAAQANLPRERPDQLELAVALAEVARVAEDRRGVLAVRLDAVPRDEILDDPDRFAPPAELFTAPDIPFASVVNPLVMEASGRVSPLRYGFPSAWALGYLGNVGLYELAAAWRARQGPRFAKLLTGVVDACGEPRRPAVLNWYETVAHQAAIAS